MQCENETSHLLTTHSNQAAGSTTDTLPDSTDQTDNNSIQIVTVESHAIGNFSNNIQLNDMT